MLLARTLFFYVLLQRLYPGVAGQIVESLACYKDVGLDIIHYMRKTL